MPGELASSPNATLLKFRSLSFIIIRYQIKEMHHHCYSLCTYDKQLLQFSVDMTNFTFNKDSMHVISMVFFWVGVGVGGVNLALYFPEELLKKSVRFFNLEINSFCDIHLTEDSSLSLDFFGSFQCMDSINYKTVYEQ